MYVLRRANGQEAGRSQWPIVGGADRWHAPDQAWFDPAPGDGSFVELVPDPIVSVTMRQARLALLGAGLLSAVEDALNALPEPMRSAARIEWEYAQTVDRDNPFTASLASALGLSDAQLDQLFAAAAAL